MLKAFTEPLFSVRRHLITIHIAAIHCLRYFFSGSILEIIYTLWIFFRGGSGRQLFQLSQQFATVRQRFLFVFQQQHSQLITYFHRPVIFPDLVDFPNDLKFSARNFHFPVSTIVIRFNIHSQLFERTYSVFCKKSHSQQVHEPAYK